ncbi:hypothetical protein OGM63_09045 [Plectonema radiosum NIES-515]|uniref:Uncharacterized protein n=1 Tax=Plectonema radiosum NIES-515 TaxID=2986073 RepID=A0ABT3AX31_9CYAN|nr:hypothetical protein [Plectonema radiosum]MCV3213671.1 hypothetical protein [Plectonema radiosum NIES-515]
MSPFFPFPFRPKVIIAVYFIVDDLLKAIGHDEDVGRGISDA